MYVKSDSLRTIRLRIADQGRAAPNHVQVHAGCNELNEPSSA